MPIILVDKYPVDSVGTADVAAVPVVASAIVTFAVAAFVVVDNLLIVAEPIFALSVDIVDIVDAVVVVVAVVIIDDHFVLADPAATAVDFVDSVGAVADFSVVGLTVYMTVLFDLYLAFVVLDRDLLFYVVADYLIEYH